MQTKPIVLALFSLLACSCAVPSAGDDAVDSTEAAQTSDALVELRLGEIVAHPIRVDQRVVLAYDTRRLETCGTLRSGEPSTTTIELSWRVNGGAVHTAPLGASWFGGTGSTTARALLGPFTAGDVGTLELWLRASSPSGCVAWDSDFGKNHRFFLHDTRVATLVFDGVRGHAPAAGPLPSGGTLVVDYDGARVPGCAVNLGEGEHFVAMRHRFDGHGDWQETVHNTFFGRRFTPIAVPPGAHHVELWFEAFDRHGCHDYDSRGGQNYAFSLE